MPATRRRARRFPAWRSAPAPPPTTSKCFRCRWRELGGRRPVFSLSPVPGALDAIVSSELLETARQIGNGMSAPERTLVITSSSRTLTTAERMQPGDGRADAQRLLDVVKAFSREHHVFDMGAVAREAGTVVSAVMLGAIAGSGLFPFPREAYEARGARRRHQRARKGQQGGRGQPARLREGLRCRDTRRASRPRWSRACWPPSAGRAHRAPQALPPTLARSLSRRRCTTCWRSAMRALLDYQDAAYADALRRAPAAGAGRRARRRPGRRARLRHHPRDGALARAVDGLRRHRARGRTQEPRQRARSACTARSRPATTTSSRSTTTSSPARPNSRRCCRPSLAAPRDRMGPRASAGQAPWALPLKVGSHSVFGMAVAAHCWRRCAGCAGAAAASPRNRR